MKKKKNDRIFMVLIALVVLIFAYYFWSMSKPGELDSFASCLETKGAKFYGAFWCPHCQNQKKMFGNSAKLLPYIECSTADQKNQLQICIDQKIQSYPTWIFSDDSRKTGEVSLKELAEKTGCELNTSKPSASSTPINNLPTSTASAT